MEGLGIMPSPLVFLRMIRTLRIFIKIRHFGNTKITIYIGGHFYAQIARSTWTANIGN